LDALVNRASREALGELLSLNLAPDYLPFLEGGGVDVPPFPAAFTEMVDRRLVRV
jgi:hypothetical protein